MSQTFTVSGTYTVPSNTTQIKIECWGAGAGGGTYASGLESTAGGGGGAYSRVNTFNVTGGATYSVVVGAKGLGSITTNSALFTAGGDSTFNSTTCVAKGGAKGTGTSNTSVGGVGGLASAGTGDVKFNGGSGGSHSGISAIATGAGSSAGTAANGNNGADGDAGGAAPVGGGKGGDGSSNNTVNAQNGSFPGGGGGGIVSSAGFRSGDGAGGQVVITDVLSVPIVTTQAVTNIGVSTATGNGTITDAGLPAATTKGFCYMLGTSGNPTTANFTVFDTGTFSTGVYTKTLTGLVAGQAYRVRAYATNSTGTSYGTTVQLYTSNTVNLLVVGGGGNGGTLLGNNNAKGGGGGGGGVLINTSFPVNTEGAYPVTVGAAGSNSSFSDAIAIGGGNGGGANPKNGSAGGSGGGGGAVGTGVGSGGAGTSGQGFAGGNSGSNNFGLAGGGGGGGAGAIGTDGNSSAVGGNGGNGIQSSISGTATYYGGGGGGGATTPGSGGLGGGGAGGGNGVNGTANTGGGGGGAKGSGSETPGIGGTGIVIIAFPTDGSTGLSTSSTGGTITTVGGNQIHTFTTNGTFTAVFNTPIVTTDTPTPHIASITAAGTITNTGHGSGAVTTRGFVYMTGTSGTPVMPVVKVFISAGDSTGGPTFNVPIGTPRSVGGGTGGTWQYRSGYVLYGTSYPIVIGNGGTGNDSSFDALNAFGGGAATSNGVAVISYDPTLYGANTGGTIIEAGATQTYTYTSDSSWLCPDGVTSVDVECWGGGGSGGTRTTTGRAGGGGGGAYAKSTISVTPGTTYSFTIGGAGTATQFNSNQVLAAGGTSVGTNVTTHGAGGQASASIGDIKYSGGDGTDADVGSTGGGGGGEGAGTTADGNPASGHTGGTGGDGGDGGNGAVVNGNGAAGSVTGGGGGGAMRSSGTRNGGSGAAGQVKLTYSSSERSHTFTSNGTFTVVSPVADSRIYENGSFGTGAYTLLINSLTPGTSYRIRAFAQNSSGISYGSVIQTATLGSTAGNFMIFF